MRTLGVDLASGDRDTAVCRVDWSGRQPLLERLWVGASDDDILRLAERAEVVASPEQVELLARSDHALDALVAALVGRVFERGWAAGPETPDEREAARIEGWIWLPTCALEALRTS